MARRNFKLKSKVWLYPGMAGWHFINVDKKEAKEIKDNFGKFARGFRSLKVSAKIGKTSWFTSIFPDKGGVYLLPLNAKVRKAEGISTHDTVKFEIKIRIKELGHIK